VSSVPHASSVRAGHGSPLSDPPSPRTAISQPGIARRPLSCEWRLDAASRIVSNPSQYPDRFDLEITLPRQL